MSCAWAVKSMQTEQINHDTAHAFMNTGSIIKGRPSMGSWLLYGLGSETEELPGFVVLTSAGKYGQQPGVPRANGRAASCPASSRASSSSPRATPCTTWAVQTACARARSVKWWRK